MQALGDIVMQLMEKRKKRNEVIGASDLDRWSPTVVDFLSETMSASAKDLTQVSFNYIAQSTVLTSTASVPREWMAEGGPPLSDIIRPNFLTQVLQD